jgi:hypothetical protein
MHCARTNTHNSAVVAIVIVHDGEIEESDLQNRCEIVASVLEHWRSKVFARYTDNAVPCVRVSLCVHVFLRARVCAQVLVGSCRGAIKLSYPD